MGSLLDAFRFFEQYPGDLLFFLVICALGQISFFFAFGQRQRFPAARTTQRYSIALSALVGVWILVLATVVIALFSSVEPVSLLPPFERLALTLSVTLLAWAFVSADEEDLRRPGNLSALGMALIVSLFFLYTAYQWYLAFVVGAEFNGSVFAPIWSALPVAIAIAGLLLTAINTASIVDSPLKALFFLLIVLGNGWDLYQFSEGVVAGHYLGGARLAYMAALFLVPLLLHRQAIALLENRIADASIASERSETDSPEVEETEQGEISDELSPLLADESEAAGTREARSETLLKALGAMLDIEIVSTIPQRVVQATMAALEVDLCLLLRREDSNYADLAAGYYADTQQPLSGFSFNLDAQPSLRQAFKDGLPLVLRADIHRDEISALFRQLKIGASGSVYVQPVTGLEDVLALIVVSSPPENEALSSGQVALLEELGRVAGQILFWQQRAEAAEVLAIPAATAAGEMDLQAQEIDSEEVLRVRRELEDSFEQTAQDIVLLRATFADLLMQLHQERIRVLGNLGDEAETIAVAQQLTLVFDEQTRLREAGEKIASEILDAETVLRLLAAEQDDGLVQIVGDYVQTSYDLQVDSNDRLQDQLDLLQSSGDSLRAGDPAAFVDELTDVSRRLESDIEHLRARQADVLSKFAAIGTNAELGSLAQVLIQHLAKQTTLKNVAIAIQRQRDALLAERSQLAALGVDEMEGLRQQLKQMTTDHESLVEQRENMRRANEDLHSELEAKESESAGLVKFSSNLRDRLAASAEKQDALNKLIADLTEERDNLLQIRDQLTNKLAESLEGGETYSEAALRTELVELRAVVDDLTGHRERLEAELSELRTPAISDGQVPIDAEAGANRETSAGADVLQADIHRLMDDLKTPATAIIDGTEILLAERIGILGAAQLRVLQNVSDNVSRLTEIINELHQLSGTIDDGYTLQYREADLVTLLDDALREHTGILRRKTLAIDLSLGDGLPKIPMDTECISRILSLLLSNACEVSREGSQIQLAIEVSRWTMPGANALANVLHLKISDCGGGIDPDDIARVFARKYKSNNPRIKGFGDTGVGLTVSRALARAHGGDIWITSERGAGSTVHLALPISPSSTTEE